MKFNTSGNDTISLQAISILDDDQRQFCSSCFVRLEILAKAKYYKRQTEIEFYQSFFKSSTFWADALDIIVDKAEDLAGQYGLNALDALKLRQLFILKPMN